MKRSRDYVVLLGERVIDLVQYSMFHDIDIKIMEFVGGIAIYARLNGSSVMVTIAKNDGDDQYNLVLPGLAHDPDIIATKIQASLLSLNFINGR